MLFALGDVQPNDGQAVGEVEVRGPWVTARYLGDDVPDDELNKTSIYKVVLSKVGIRFSKDTETCAARASAEENSSWFSAATAP